MKEFAKKTGLFLLILGFISTLIGWISRYDNLDKNYSDNNNVVSLQIKSKFSGLDILFIGNSYCYSGIQPQMLDSAGLKSYNLGIATAGIKFYDLIVKDYLEFAPQKPKTVFILVSPMIFSSLADNFVSYPVHRYLEKPLSNFELLMNFGDQSGILSICQKSFKKGALNLLSRKKGTSPIFDTLYKYKGYIRSEGKVTPEIEAQGNKSLSKLLNDSFDNNKINKLMRLTGQLEERHIRAVYFELPSYRLYQFFNKNYLKKYKAGLAILSKRNLYLKIDPSTFSPDDYRDIDHLNLTGSKKATSEIITSVKLIIK